MAIIKSFGVAVSVASNDIGGLTDVSIPEVDVTFVDITTHDSSNYRDFVGGLKDGGTLTLTGAYNISDSGQSYLRTPANQGGAAVAVVVTFSDSSTCSFDAVVGGFGVSNPLDDKVEFTASLKISGDVTYAAA